jgi:hypothetical protein
MAWGGVVAVVPILWCGVCGVVYRVVRDGALQHVIIVTANYLFQSSSSFLRGCSLDGRWVGLVLIGRCVGTAQ